MSEYGLLFLGDVVGRPGRKVVCDNLKKLIADPTIAVVDARDFVPAPVLFAVVNGENATAGFGISPENAEDLFKAGADAITLGNHWFNRREVYGYLDSGKPIVRPANLAPGAPGKGICKVTKEGISLCVINLCGRVFMDSYDDPFRSMDRILGSMDTDHVLVDFHAEATSEKVAMGWHLDGRATMMVGTHTHIPTADEQILPGGTAYISDVGMSGPFPSVIGMDKDIVLQKFVTGLPARFEVAEQPGVISGVIANVERNTGRATAIRRIRLS